MIGIQAVASYIPEKRRSNFDRLSVHKMDADFLEQKIGIQSVARKNSEDKTSDMCMQAWDMIAVRDSLETKDIDCVCVCTQTPDHPIPNVSSIVHGKLGLQSDCAVFDVSHGCAGYIYSLVALKGFMTENDFKTGLLFTCDPYSEIVSDDDRNTDLLFGDAATVTVLSENAVYDIGKTSYHTEGEKYGALIKRDGDSLKMDGREIFNFVMGQAPKSILACLEKNKVELEKVDLFLLHQASLFLVSNLTKRLGVERSKVPFDIGKYGNTVSSSVPLLLEKAMNNSELKALLLSGYGVGLCIATTVLIRR